MTDADGEPRQRTVVALASRRRLKNSLLFALAWCAFHGLKRLPIGALLRLGAAVGLVVHALARASRRRARQNIDAVFPERSDAQRRALVRENFRRLGTLLADGVALAAETKLPASRLPFDEAARATFRDARAHGRGIILVTAHFGPWERLAATIVGAGFPLTTPVRRSYDPRLEAHIVEPTRARHGVKTLDRDDPHCAKRLMRALRSHDVVGFLVDLNTRVPSIDAPFLGQSARTVSAPARLALATGAPVVLAMARKSGVVTELLRDAARPSTKPSSDDVRALTTAINEAIGVHVRDEPESWIWLHDRWGRGEASGDEIRATNRETPLTATRTT